MTASSSTSRSQRRAPRSKLFQPAELRKGTAVQRVHLLDLSVAGVLIHAAVPPAPGAMVMLVCGGLSRMARVAWVRDGRVGLAFVLRLNQSELDAIIAPGPESGTGVVERRSIRAEEAPEPA